MRLSILLLLWPVLAQAQTIDEAFPPTIRVEPSTMYSCRVKIDRAHLDTGAAPLSWFVAELSTDRPCRWTELSLELPAGTRVVGMSVEARGARSWSAARPVREARAAVDRGLGTGLLEWQGSSGDQDRFRALLPMPVRLELALELPPLGHVVIEATRRLDVDLRGVPARTTPAPYAYLDARTALVTGAPHRDEPAPIHRRWPAAPSGGGDKASIRRGIRRNLGRITHCYERVAQWRGEIEGTASLQFLVSREGAVENVKTAETDLPPAITRCIEDVMRAWRFDGLEGTTLVNYPLRFSTPRS